VVILVVALVIFGPKKLPELGKNLGKGLKSFKQGLEEAGEEFKSEFNEKKD
jgi:sec-independent protein translocase protein TatA